MKYKQITIVCPYFETGGPEALHQLCGIINDNGGNAYIWYYGEDRKCHPSYSQYNVRITTNMLDDVDCAVVLTEGDGKIINEIIKSKIFFWWLASGLHKYSFEENKNSFQDKRITHLYQSYYALHYLWNRNASQYLPLFDYINPRYFNVKPVEKQDIVCYNPKKGYEITKQIIDNNPHVNFVPLINMNTEQVIEILNKSKLYIDFGYHPGKDRFPREAAILRNCVILGWRGSAMFYNDVPVPFKYKFNSLDGLNEMINDIIQCWESHNLEFQQYRSVISQQKEEFIIQIKQIFI